jgi:hypothetical protein
MSSVLNGAAFTTILSDDICLPITAALCRSHPRRSAQATHRPGTGSDCVSRSNVVSVLFPKTAPVAADPALRDGDLAVRVVALSARADGPQAALTIDPVPNDEVGWALAIAAQDRRLSFAVVDARKRLNRLVRETCPKPVFVPTGAGYEDVSLTVARAILSDRYPDFGAAEMELLAALEAFDAAEQSWNAARKQLSVTCGLDALIARREALSDDAAEAHEILRVHGIDPAHHHESGEQA